MYYTLKDEKMHPIHEREISALMRTGHTVYTAPELPRISYHPRYAWIAVWLDPKALKAAEVELAAAGYRTWAERIMCYSVRWGRYGEFTQHERHFAQSPREKVLSRPTDPGRIWVQLRVPAGFYDTVRVPDEIEKNETRLVPADQRDQTAVIRAAAEKIEAATDTVRVAKNPTGEIVWQETPPVGVRVRAPEEWLPGDLVYVPSKKMWGRFWNFTADSRSVEIGPVHVRSVGIDEKTRDLHRVGIVPVAACVRIAEELGSGFGDGSWDGIAQKKGHGGARWSTAQVAALS